MGSGRRIFLVGTIFVTCFSLLFENFMQEDCIFKWYSASFLHTPLLSLEFVTFSLIIVVTHTHTNTCVCTYTHYKYNLMTPIHPTLISPHSLTVMALRYLAVMFSQSLTLKKLEKVAMSRVIVLGILSLKKWLLIYFCPCFLMINIIYILREVVMILI